MLNQSHPPLSESSVDTSNTEHNKLRVPEDKTSLDTFSFLYPAIQTYTIQRRERKMENKRENRRGYDRLVSHTIDTLPGYNPYI